MSANIHVTFVTGTDTGVGKTVLTCLLFAHLRAKGEHVMALKPFCSGGRHDAELLYALQDGECDLDDINPFHYSEPVSPLVAARSCGKSCELADFIAWFRKKEDHMQSMSEIASLFEILDRADKGQNPAGPRRQPILFVEGAGGLLSPLGEGFDLLTLMHGVNAGEKHECEVSVIVAAANRLGTINHTLLTVRALWESGISNIAVVMNDVSPDTQRTPDMHSNATILEEMLNPVRVFQLPHLKGSLSDANQLRQLAKTHAHLLTNILNSIQAA